MYFINNKVIVLSCFIARRTVLEPVSVEHVETFSQ